MKSVTPESLEGLESQSLERLGKVVSDQVLDCDNDGDALDSDEHHKPLISVRERKICETKCDLVLMCHLTYRNKVLGE